MNGKQALPNALSLARMVLCVPLVVLPAFSPAFFAVYLLCGLTDLLDGFLARRWKAASALGAKLDSLADVVFFAALLLVLGLNVALPGWAVLWTAGIALCKLAAVLVGYKRHRALFSLHTYANKAAGVVVFCLPVLVALFGVAAAAVVACAAASLAAAEELVINATSTELNLDKKSLFGKP